MTKTYSVTDNNKNNNNNKNNKNNNNYKYLPSYLASLRSRSDEREESPGREGEREIVILVAVLSRVTTYKCPGYQSPR